MDLSTFWLWPGNPYTSSGTFPSMTTWWRLFSEKSEKRGGSVAFEFGVHVRVFIEVLRHPLNEIIIHFSVPLDFRNLEDSPDATLLAVSCFSDAIIIEFPQFWTRICNHWEQYILGMCEISIMLDNWKYYFSRTTIQWFASIN